MRITQEELKDILDYDSETGSLVWKHSSPSTKKRDLAGKVYTNGYRYIAVAGTYYPVALLVWIYVTGEDPGGIIDHIDLNRTNDKFENLRPATNSQNHANRLPPKHNTSGIKGVFWNSQKLKWHARAVINGKQKHFGFFDTIEAAAIAYREGAVAAWGEFANVPSDAEIAEVAKAHKRKSVVSTPEDLGL